MLTQEYTQSHQLWGSNTFLFSAIKQRQVLTKLLSCHDVIEDWHNIGQKLGLDADILSKIDKGSADVRGKFERVFMEFERQNQGEFNATELYEGLKSLKHEDAASKYHNNHTHMYTIYR